MTGPPTHLSPAADAPHVPLVCLSCGYELAGLANGALCPECAFPVARSRERTTLLRTADPAWVAGIHRSLGRLAWAMRTILWLFCGLIAFGLLSMTIEYFAGSGPSARDAAEPVLAVLAFIVLGVAAALHVRGCLGLSAGTFGGFAAGPLPRAVLLVAGLLLPLCAGYTLLLGRTMGALPPWGATVLRACFQAVAIAFLFGLAAGLEAIERGTASWNDDLRRRHRNVRKNLYGLTIIIALMFWTPFGSRPAGSAGSWGESLFALAYILMLTPVGRVQKAAAMERAIRERAA